MIKIALCLDIVSGHSEWWASCFQAKMPSSADQAKTIIVPPLKNICLSSYLAFLESACAGNIRCDHNSKQKLFSSLHTAAHEPEPNVQAAHLLDAARPQEPPRDDTLWRLLLRAQACTQSSSLLSSFSISCCQTDPRTGSRCSRCSSPESSQVPCIRTHTLVCEHQLPLALILFNLEDLQNVPDDPGSHEDRARYQQIKVIFVHLHQQHHTATKI